MESINRLPMVRPFSGLFLSLFNLEGTYPSKYGGIAQLGEHLLCKQGVIGSIPIISTRRGPIAQLARAHD